MLDTRSAAFVHDRWLPVGVTVRTLEDPHDGTAWAQVSDAGPEAVNAAVAAAGRAQPGWAARPATVRAELLLAWAAELETCLDELVALQRSESGRLATDAEGGVLAAVDTLRQLAVLGPLHGGRVLLGAAGAVDQVRRVPIGVAAVLSPWNDPVPVLVQGMAAALVTGNTVVAKPSERAPCSSARAFQALVEAAPPAGVANLVLGDAAVGAALVADERVGVVVCTGSVATGRAVARACAARGARTVLELGGNDALVVDADVDPVAAAAQAATGAFANAGQLCTSVERAYVHRAVAAAFIDAVSQAADAAVMGPLVDRLHRDHVHGHVREAIDRGARCTTGGAVPAGPGAWYPATVLVDVDDGAAALTEETFGPVLPVCVVDDFDEGLARAAGGAYGLAATVLTGSPVHAEQAWRTLPVGTVKVGAVFGGAPGGSADPAGASGDRAGYGPDLLDELTRRRALHWTVAGP